MNTIYTGLVLCGSVICFGCQIPKGEITSVTTSGIGLSFGYNPASQMPEVKIGFFRQTFHFVPSNSPPVTSSISLEQHGFSANIFEEFTTGGAIVPTNSIARMRAERLIPFPIRTQPAHALSFTNTDMVMPPWPLLHKEQE